MVMLLYYFLTLQNVAVFNCPGKVNGHHPTDKVTCQNNLITCSSYEQAISNNWKLESRSKNMCQVCSLQVPDNKMETSDVCL